MECPSLQRLGTHLLHTAAWCWTADAMVGGAYVRDAVKFETAFLPHTRAAAAVTDGESLRHEHAVPRKQIVAHLTSLCRWSELAEDDAVSEIQSVLAACPPVIVTAPEATKLDAEFRSRMPDGWHFGESPFARYVASGLVQRIDQLVFPDDGFWSQAGSYRVIGAA